MTHVIAVIGSVTPLIPRPPTSEHIFALDCRILGGAFAAPGAYQLNVIGGLSTSPPKALFAGSRTFGKKYVRANGPGHHP